MHVLLWIAVCSLFASAMALGVLAWRTRRGELNRESAQVELLRTLAFPDAPVDLTYQVATPADESEPPVAMRPWWVPIATGGAALVLVATLYALLATFPWSVSGTPAAQSTAASNTDGPARAATVKPIEVLALQYRFDASTGAHVSGRILNPVNNRGLSDLMADVELVDPDGRVLTSQMTPLERPLVGPGQTVSFEAVFPHVSGKIARYQVRFRLHGGEALPQIDRRATEPAAKPSTS